VARSSLDSTTALATRMVSDPPGVKDETPARHKWTFIYEPLH
jgi:hypothetical protein